MAFQIEIYKFKTGIYFFMIFERTNNIFYSIKNIKKLNVLQFWKLKYFGIQLIEISIKLIGIKCIINLSNQIFILKLKCIISFNVIMKLPNCVISLEWEIFKK